MSEILAWGRSDVGKVREKNEDSFGVFSFGDMTVAVVADGMGGHLGGKAASGAAVQAVGRLFQTNHGRLPIPEIIEDALVLANRTIGEISQADFQKLKIGTTCTVAVVAPVPAAEKGGEEDAPFLSFHAHLGDSRLFHLRDGSIVQLSTDHTMLQRMVEAGAISPAEAERFPHKNIIYRSLDGSSDLQIDPVGRTAVRPGDALILCSDGLSNRVSPEELSEVVRGSPSLKEAVKHLISLANARGGDDNITVVILECGPHRRDPAAGLEIIRSLRRHALLRVAGTRQARIACLLGALAIAAGVLTLQVSKYRATQSMAAGHAEAREIQTPQAGIRPDNEDEFAALLKDAKMDFDNGRLDLARERLAHARKIKVTPELEEMEKKVFSPIAPDKKTDSEKRP